MPEKAYKRKLAEARNRANVWVKKNSYDSDSSDGLNEKRYSRSNAVNGNENSRANQERTNKGNLVNARMQAKNKLAQSSIAQGAKSFAKITEGGPVKAPIEALKLAHTFRKKVKEGDNSPYWVALIFAIIVDICDITWIIGFCLKIFLFYFLWGKGTFKVRIICKILVLADCIPIISWLPLSSISVLYAWRHSAKEVKKAKAELKELNEAYV